MEKPIISIVASIARNGAIGNKGGLPWRIPGGHIWFQDERLKGHTAIIGRRTFDILHFCFGKLPADRNIIAVSGSKCFSAAPSVNKIAATFNEAIEYAIKIEHRDIFLCGGASIFLQGLKIAKRIYLTEVDECPEGETYFPEWRNFLPSFYPKELHQDWTQMACYKWTMGCKGTVRYRFSTLERRHRIAISFEEAGGLEQNFLH